MKEHGRNLQQQDIAPRPKVGLALGGGGARGYAHIGVLQTLVANHIPIDVVTGTSMGAVIGSAFVCGHDMDKVVKLLAALDLHALLGVPQKPLSAVVERVASEYFFKQAKWRDKDQAKTKQLLEFYKLITHNRSFESLEIPFAAIAADVDTGAQIVIERGKIYRALAASVALPGIHDPVRWNGRLLVDGAVVNKVPIDAAVALGADVVIAVDVSGDISEKVNTSLQVIAQASAITSRELMRTQVSLMRSRLGKRLIVLCPSVGNVKTLNLNELRLPIEAGVKETQAALSIIRQALQPTQLT